MDYQTSLRTMVGSFFFWQNFTIFWEKKIEKKNFIA